MAEKLKIELPEHERGRSAYDLHELDRINRRLVAGYRSTKGKTVEAQREDDLRRRDELERRPDLKSDQRWRDQAIGESAMLAACRGETVAEDKSGVKRILDRDPLLSLARVGKLTPDQLEVGQTVREMYDLRGSDAGAIEYTGMPGTAHDHEKFVSRGFTKAKACKRIGDIERAVAAREPNALAMLRAVCERGLSLSSQGEGRALERNAASLALALDVADDVLTRRL